MEGLLLPIYIFLPLAVNGYNFTVLVTWEENECLKSGL